ncbi:unnamed protein product [Sphagnum tenellum]
MFDYFDEYGTKSLFGTDDGNKFDEAVRKSKEITAQYIKLSDRDLRKEALAMLKCFWNMDNVELRFYKFKNVAYDATSDYQHMDDDIKMASNENR